MQISIEKTSIKDLIIVKPEIFRDERGFFCEVYRPDWAKGRGGRCMGWVEGNWGSLEQKCWQEGGEMRA